MKFTGDTEFDVKSCQVRSQATLECSTGLAQQDKFSLISQCLNYLVEQNSTFNGHNNRIQNL